MIEFKYKHEDLRGEILTEISHLTREEGLNEVVQEFRHFLLAVGFHPDSVKKYIEED